MSIPRWFEAASIADELRAVPLGALGVLTFDPEFCSPRSLV